MYSTENLPMRDKKTGAEIRNWMRLLEHSLALVISKKLIGTLYLFFFLTKKAENLKTICACTKNTD